jgi:hypothetical protein
MVKTVTRSAPSFARRVAKVCRHICEVTLGNPARFTVASSALRTVVNFSPDIGL